MLSAILMFMVLILLCTIRLMILLICGSNLSWVLNFNQTYKALWIWVEIGLLILVLGKLNLFHLIVRITLALFENWWVLILMKNHLLRCWDSLFLLNWVGVLTLSQMLKLLLRKKEPWFEVSFFSSCVLSLNLPFCFIWNTFVISRLMLLTSTCIYMHV